MLVGMLRRRRRIQRGAVAIGVGRVCRCRFLCLHLRPLAFHCPVPCASRRGREELGETRSSRASHGEKGVTITAANVLQPSSLVPGC